MKYVLVTGGELRNKGAQAMVFTTVSQIAKRFPDCRVLLFSGGDVKRSEEEKKNYKFDIVSLPRMRNVISPKEPYFKDAVALIDISGYRLGSNWGTGPAISYMKMIMIAKRLGIPVYLMPQSFGPFEFKGSKAPFVNFLLKHYLKYPKYIMAREDEGAEALKNKYKLKNVIRTPDLVLQNKEIDLATVYVNVPEMPKLDIKPSSVAVIPNSKNNKYGSEEENLAAYKRIVDILLEKGKNVYFIYHAIEDLKVCREIKERFYSDTDAVTVVERELSCIEFGQTVGSFDFLIASRYHSVVHSYKEGRPTVILGWAIKYRELAKLFSQERFCFDVKNALDGNDITDAVRYMCDNFSAEADKIASALTDIQKESVYDLIEL